MGIKYKKLIRGIQIRKEEVKKSYFQMLRFYTSETLMTGQEGSESDKRSLQKGFKVNIKKDTSRLSILTKCILNTAEKQPS